MSKINIFWYGDSPTANTGFGVVNKNLSNGLYNTGKYSFGYLGVNYRKVERLNFPGDFMLYPLSDPNDPYGFNEFANVLSKENPDIIFLNQDIYILGNVNTPQKMNFVDICRDIHPGVPVIVYFPLDGNYIASEWVNGVVKKADYAFTISKHSKRIVKIYGDTDIDTLTHGIDTNIFKVFDADRIATIKRSHHWHDKFVMVNINRLQPRKGIHLTLRIANMFLNGYKICKNCGNYFPLHLDRCDLNGCDGGYKVVDRKNDGLIYMHMNNYDPNFGNTGADTLDSITLGAGFPLDNGQVFRPNYDVYSANIPAEKLNNIYNVADVFITTSLGEGFGLCVHPSTIINSKSRFKQMRDIAIGDEVMTRDGLYHDVDDIVIRTSKLIKASISKHPNLLISPEHPFLSKKSVSDRMMVDKKKLDFNNPKWVRIDDLKKNDWVGIVKPKQVNGLPKQIDLVDYVDGVSFVWYQTWHSPLKNGASISDIQEKYMVSKRVAEDARRCVLGIPMQSMGGKRSDAYAIAKMMVDDGYVLNDGMSKVNRYITIDDKFLNFIGWYIAGGSSSDGSGIELDFNLNVIDNVRELKKYAEKAFGVTAVIDVNREHKCRLIIRSRVLSIFFSRYCGNHAQNKKIPSDIALAYGDIIPLVKGVMLGNGCFGKDAISMGMTSMQVIWQLRDILLANNILPSISGPMLRRGDSDFDMWAIRVGGNDRIKLCNLLGVKCDNTKQKRGVTNYVETDDMFFVRIKGIEDAGESEVMDISVRGEHSFVGNGVLLHNTTAEAMATGTTVIAPKHTSNQEIVGSAGRLINNSGFTGLGFDTGQIRQVIDIPEAIKALEEEYGKWLDNDRKKVINKRARHRIEKYFQWPDVVNKLDGVITKLLTEKRITEVGEWM